MTDRPDRPDRPEPADSGGTPWLGRDLPAAPFAGDDGTADPELAAALAQPGADEAVVSALATARVFVAVVAMTSAAAELAVLTLTRPDGRRALPVFTSVTALAAWRPEARPVPIPGPRAALSAVAEGCDLLQLDPAGPVSHLVRRPALWALGQGRRWTPSYADPDVLRSVTDACDAEGLRSRVGPGSGSELRVVVGPPPELVGPELEAALDRVSRRLAADEHFAAGVDTVEITVVPVRG